MIIKANSIYMPLKDKSVQAIITSPPYWGLRKYDVPDIIFPGWKRLGLPCKRALGYCEILDENGICERCGAWRGQLGLEPTPELYISHLMQVMSECWRVLREDGVCWVNLGDTYSGSGGAGGDYAPNGLRAGQPKYRQGRPGVKTKSLCFIPERFAIACLEAGWIIRNKVIWHKPNGMPSSVKDRFAVKWEQVYMLVKQGKYYFDLDVVRTRAKQSSIERVQRAVSNNNKWVNGPEGKNPHNLSQPRPNRKMDKGDSPSLHRNYKGAGNRGREQGCAISNHQFEGGDYLVAPPSLKGVNPGDVWNISTQGYPGAHFATFPPKLIERMLLCSTKPGDIVLDPFGGSGTVGRVAIKYRRHPVLLDLGYQEQQTERLNNVQVNLCLGGA